MDRLEKLEQRSLYVIREAYIRHKNCALLWSAGKDSTVMLWIARKAFFGKIPFPVIHIDTSYYFNEVYTFREKYEKEWGLNLITTKNEKAIKKGMGPECKEKSDCCNALKTIALKNIMESHPFNALLAGIRGDEQEILDKGAAGEPIPLGKSFPIGKAFPLQGTDMLCGTRDMQASLLDIHLSEMNTMNHFRIHPLVFWTLYDIWQYIKREKIPVLSLYFAHNGKRYRSIGCQSCCTPVDSAVTTIRRILKEHERIQVSAMNGKTGESEDAYTIQKLKSLGYM